MFDGLFVVAFVETGRDDSEDVDEAEASCEADEEDKFVFVDAEVPTDEEDDDEVEDAEEPFGVISPVPLPPFVTVVALVFSAELLAIATSCCCCCCCWTAAFIAA